MKESHENPAAHTQLGKRVFTFFVVAEFVLLAGNLLARIAQRTQWLPSWIIVLIAVLTSLPMVFFGLRFFGMLRQDLDEMVQRIVLEGLAFAMIIFIPLAGIYVNARASGLVHLRLDPPELLLVPSILVAVGILLSWSRHK